MSNLELKSDRLAELRRDLKIVEECRKTQFAAIVRHIRRRETAGQANGVMVQIRRDEKLCKLLVEYEGSSEVIGMMEFVIGRDVER
jgi:hypothetical protein